MYLRTQLDTVSNAVKINVVDGKNQLLLVEIHYVFHSNEQPLKAN